MLCQLPPARWRLCRLHNMAFPNHMVDGEQNELGVTVYVEHTGMPYDHARGSRGLVHVVCTLLRLRCTSASYLAFGNTVPKWTDGRSVPMSSKRSTSLC